MAGPSKQGAAYAFELEAATAGALPGVENKRHITIQ